MVRDVVVHPDGGVEVTVALTVAGCPCAPRSRIRCSGSSAPVDGVDCGQAAFRRDEPRREGGTVERLRGGRPEKTISLLADDARSCVASGKGGVGKSTLTANLAAALAARGEKVGVLDADVYGHSIPHMLGVQQRPVVVDTMIVPPVRGDLKLMSIGFFLDDNAPVMWRGPMLHRALEQFLSDVYWGELDTLLVDMPPGTGDVAISLGQLLPRAEVVIVTTPQPAAQQVAVRAAGMAEKVGHADRRAWSRTCRTSSAPARRSSARAAARRSPTRSACRCSAASRSTPRCARPAMRACPSSSPRPTAEATTAIIALAERDPAHAPRLDPQGPDRPLLAAFRAERRRAPVGALRDVCAARVAVSERLVKAPQRPGGADVVALHVDLGADREAGRHG